MCSLLFAALDKLLDVAVLDKSNDNFQHFNHHLSNTAI